jgi:hypothetical protein
LEKLAGAALGELEGTGALDGAALGALNGAGLGLPDGVALGALDGAGFGLLDGAALGTLVGTVLGLLLASVFADSKGSDASALWAPASPPKTLACSSWTTMTWPQVLQRIRRIFCLTFSSAIE